jgi:uncharacterized membrane protein YcaP (DUF421 family)
MEAVLRAVGVYVMLLVAFRLTGKRSLAQVTTFDLVLLLIIGEATQQALLGEDFSVTHAAVVISTLLVLERIADIVTWRSPALRRATESQPVVLVDDGRVLWEQLDHYHLSVDDVVTAARERHGLQGMADVQWAVLEVSGSISVVPRSSQPAIHPDGVPVEDRPQNGPPSGFGAAGA